MFTFYGYKHQGHSICSRKPPSKFVIGAFFRLHQGHSICSRKPPSKFVIGAFFRLVMLFAVFGHFFFVYLNYFENCWEMFTFNGYKHQGHSICSRKPPSKFVIGAFFRLHQGHSICSRKPPSKFVIGAFFRLHQGHSICSRKPPSKFVIGAFFRLHQGHSICSRKPPSKFVIGAFFRLVMLFAVFGHFFFFFLNYFENCWEMFTFNGYKHQGHSICSRKPPSKFVIGAFFRLDLPVSVIFFLFYLNYLENCWEMFTFIGYMHQGHSICSRKPPSKFVIGAFFRLVMLYNETKKKNFRNL
ncbi:hypothetical protein AGLY_016376 [Aphis glycines]|uniref:Uncharacterized protein n=1 Tax=Aphis glycines TaxID=307491 RepID=A0A6G0SXX2_APHGL|nr:hypothetical protein AGLY_016376 [Aphis glycines]